LLIRHCPFKLRPTVNFSHELNRKPKTSKQFSTARNRKLDVFPPLSSTPTTRRALFLLESVYADRLRRERDNNSNRFL